MEEDKSCIICHKRKMNWPRYSDHLETAHNVYQYEDGPTYMNLDNIIYVRDTWVEEEKPSPNPRYYDSVNDQEISEFESASNESSDDEGPPKLIKLPVRIKREESSSAGSSSESEDCQSDSSIQSKPNRSRQQVGKRLKDVSKQVDVINENIGNFEGRLVGIEDEVSNISKDLNSIKTVHKSGISALKNTVENGSKTFEENIQRMQSELKSMSESSAKLETKLEKSQELSKDLDIKLLKSQIMQKESNDELKKLQEESSKEIQGLKENISEIMAFLKNKEESHSENSKTIERLDDSVTKETDNTGIVSTDNLCIPPEVMTSPSFSSMIDSSHSVVKRTLEEDHSEEETPSISDH